MGPSSRGRADGTCTHTVARANVGRLDEHGGEHAQRGECSGTSPPALAQWCARRHPGVHRAGRCSPPCSSSRPTSLAPRCGCSTIRPARDEGPIWSGPAADFFGLDGPAAVVRRARRRGARFRLYVAPVEPAIPMCCVASASRTRFLPGAYRLDVDPQGQKFTLTAHGRDGVVQEGSVGDSVGAAIGFVWLPPAGALTAGRAWNSSSRHRTRPPASSPNSSKSARIWTATSSAWSWAGRIQRSSVLP